MAFLSEEHTTETPIARDARLASQPSRVGLVRSRRVGLFGIVSVLVRWWYLVGLVLGVGLFLAVRSSENVEPEYLAFATVVVIGSNEVERVNPATGELVVEQVNPLVRIGSQLETVAALTAISMRDRSVYTQLEEEGLSTNVEVVAESRSPVLEVTVTDRDPLVAATTVDRMIELIEEDLDRRQDALGAPDDQRVLVTVISETTVGGADFGGRTRTAIAFAAAALGASLLVAYTLEGVVEWGKASSSEPASHRRGSAPWGLRRLGAGYRWRFEVDRLTSSLHLIVGSRLVAERVASEAFGLAIGLTDDPFDAHDLIRVVYSEAVRIAHVAAPASLSVELPPHLGPVEERVWRSLANASTFDRAVVALHLVAELPEDLVASILDAELSDVQRTIEAVDSAV